MYVCMYTGIYVCMYVCGNQPTSEVLDKSMSQIQYACMYVCMNVCMYVCMRHNVNKINNGNRIDGYRETLQAHHLSSPLSFYALLHCIILCFAGQSSCLQVSCQTLRQLAVHLMLQHIPSHEIDLSNTL